MIESGSWYSSGFEWPHDGNPYESENFTIFSDAASINSRKLLAEAGEEVFLELKEQFEISDNRIFQFPEGQKKVHVFAYKDHFPREWGGQAYYGGYMIYSPDHEERGKEGHTDPETYFPVVRHELTHTIQNLILGRLDNTLVDVWLSEGLAETISKSNVDRRIDSPKKLEALREKYGDLNPISMHLYEYPDIENVGRDYYYPMFQLAVTYLTDPNGLSKNIVDIRDLLIDVRDGTEFATAFENRFGISLEYYEDHFFDLMDDYLRSKIEQ